MKNEIIPSRTFTLHTPGPWKLKQHGINHYTLTGSSPGLIADIHRDEDAQIIAAAPDLLAALRGLLNALPSATTHPAIRAARAAIANATGDEQ